MPVPVDAPPLPAPVPLPPGVQLSSPLKRLGECLLEDVLFIVTLGIGWMLWALVILERGQTPAKQILGMKVARPKQQRVAGWGVMFVREFLVKGLLMTILSVVTLYIGWVVACLLILGKSRQTLWDKICNTYVVDDPNKVLG